MCFKSAFLSRFVQSQLHIAKQPQTNHPRLTRRKKKYRDITGCCDTRAVNQVRQLKDSIGTFTGILYSCLSRCKDRRVWITHPSLPPGYTSTVSTIKCIITGSQLQLEQLDSHSPPTPPPRPTPPPARLAPPHRPAPLPSHAMSATARLYRYRTRVFFNSRLDASIAYNCCLVTSLQLINCADI